MKTIVLTAAAFLAISSSAFAGSDNYGSNRHNQPAVSVDNQSTGSISDGASTVRKLLNPSDEAQKPATFGSDRNLFGR